MFKRVRWMSVGAAAGAAGTVWTQRTVRRQLERTDRAELAATARGMAGRSARRLARRLSGAIEEGRSAMRDRDAERRGEPIDLRAATPGRTTTSGAYRPARWGERSTERR